MSNLTLSHPPHTNSDAVVLFQFISLGLLIAVGSAGNSLVVYAFCRLIAKKRAIGYQIRRMTPHTYMLGFVSLDLLRVLLCFPILFVAVVHPLQIKYGKELCKFIAFTNVFCPVVNSVFICAMTVDKYMESKYYNRYQITCQHFFEAVLLSVLLSLGLVFTLPTESNAYDKLVFHKVEVYCVFPHHYATLGMGVYPILSSVSVAFCVTSWIYASLFFLLRGRRRMKPVICQPHVSENWGFREEYAMTPRNRWRAETIPQAPISVVSRNIPHLHPILIDYETALKRTKRHKDDQKTMKLCFAIHILFSAFWVPYFCSVFYLTIGGNKFKTSYWFEVLVTWLSFIQSIITPFAFFSMPGLRKFHNKRCSSTLSSSIT